MIDRMYQSDDFGPIGSGAGAPSRGNWTCARGFELVHSSRVEGRQSSLLAGLPDLAPAGPDGAQTTNDCLVSVLREEWPAGRERCRVRVIHSVAGAGPITAVITGPPVPLVVRLDRGERSIAHRFFPARIDLEIRRGGQAPGAMALPRFPLQAGSTYTIVIGEAATGIPEIQELSEEFEHAE